MGVGGRSAVRQGAAHHPSLCQEICIIDCHARAIFAGGCWEQSGDGKWVSWVGRGPVMERFWGEGQVRRKATCTEQ